MGYEREGLTRSKCPQVVPEPWATTLRSQPLCMVRLRFSYILQSIARPLALCGGLRHSGALPQCWRANTDIYNHHKCLS